MKKQITRGNNLSRAQAKRGDNSFPICFFAKGDNFDFYQTMVGHTRAAYVWFLQFRSFKFTRMLLVNRGLWKKRLSQDPEEWPWTRNHSCKNEILNHTAKMSLYMRKIC